MSDGRWQGTAMIFYSKSGKGFEPVQFEVDLSTWPADKRQRAEELVEQVIQSLDEVLFDLNKDVQYKIGMQVGDEPIGEISLSGGCFSASSPAAELLSLLENTCSVRDKNGNRCSLPLPCSNHS